MATIWLARPPGKTGRPSWRFVAVSRWDPRQPADPTARNRHEPPRPQLCGSAVSPAERGADRCRQIYSAVARLSQTLPIRDPATLRRKVLGKGQCEIRGKRTLLSLLARAATGRDTQHSSFRGGCRAEGGWGSRPQPQSFGGRTRARVSFTEPGGRLSRAGCRTWTSRRLKCS
jgi:hypothetical protein